MAKGGGKPHNEDWACCEQCSFCFTIFVGVLFFLAGGAMAVYAALFLWSDFDVSIPGLELLDVDAIQIGIFVVGLCIAGAAMLGMISAGCAKCAANPDGKHDCCEQCCTPILSTLYIIILSVLLAATLAIAGVLSYYAAVVGSSTATECPYPSGSSNRQFVSGNPPDAAACPIDYLLYEVFFGAGATEQATGNATWIAGQDAAYLCGFYCNGNAPPFGNPDWCPKAGSDPDYDIQTTGTYCSNLIPAGATVPSYTVFQGKTGSTGLGLQDNAISTFQEGTALITTEYVSMPYRPTFYSVLDSILIPALVVWWLIFVFAILLIVAACAMCILKKKTTKDSTYKPSSNV